MDNLINNIIFCGKGGNGVLYASSIFCTTLFESTDYNIISSDIHGISRRGGSVISEVRYGTEAIYSPIIECADYIVDFDGNEYKHFDDRLNSSGKILAPFTEGANMSKEIIRIDLQSKIKKYNLPLKTSNMIIIGLLVKILGLSYLPWKNFITDKYNYLSFLLGVK